MKNRIKTLTNGKTKENNGRKKEMGKQRGITLIALVITIIILLILAGISIGTLTGENGILTNAKQKIQELKQEIQNEIDNLTGQEEKQATKGCSFEIDETTNSGIEIEGKYKNRIKVINGKLTYIGNDEREKQWAIEMGIEISQN